LQVPLWGTCRASPECDPVRFTITPLGGAGRAVGQIVDAIVRYLQPRTPNPVEPASGIPREPARRVRRATTPTAARSPAAGAAEAPEP